MSEQTPSARYANAEGTDVLYDLGNGIVQAIKPGDGRLDGVEIAPYEAWPAPVPFQVTRAQARIAMASHILPDGRSLLSATREALTAQQEATSGLPDGDPARIAAVQAAEWWTAAATYQRDHPVLVAVAASLGLDAAAIDNLFRAAAAG